MTKRRREETLNVDKKNDGLSTEDTSASMPIVETRNMEKVSADEKLSQDPTDVQQRKFHVCKFCHHKFIYKSSLTRHNKKCCHDENTICDLCQDSPISSKVERNRLKTDLIWTPSLVDTKLLFDNSKEKEGKAEMIEADAKPLR